MGRAVMTQPTAQLEPLETAIARIEPTTPIDDVAYALNRLDSYMQFGRELKQRLEEAVIDWIQANGDLVIGDVRYYVGVRKTTKCIDVAAAVDALLAASGGDMQAFVACLASDALKHGAAKKVLGEQWDRYFKVEAKPKLENEQPKKELMKVDERFVK